jgi:serine/threonine protein kinase
MPSLVRTTELMFELGDEIGQEGKNSSVHKARDLQLDAEIVIKKIKKSEFSDVDEFFVEASMLYLSDHPNVVPIHYACQDKDHIYLAMPLFNNGSLKGKIANAPVTVREAIVFSTQILSALQNIHSKGLIHFDVKPDNVLISERNEAHLSDFGLAKQTTFSGHAGQDRIYGKMVPPEAFSTDQFTNQFDIYQVGLTMHRMCVGDQVFYADYSSYFSAGGALDRHRFRHAVLNGQFPITNQYPEHIPQKLISTIKCCLARDLGTRYSSAIEVVNDLSDIDGELLDWKFESNSDLRTWTKTLSDGKKFELSIPSNGGVTAYKTSAAGNRQRISAYCKDSLGRSEIKRFLREH